MLVPGAPARPITANVTLAMLKASDTLDSLMLRMVDGRAVAAERLPGLGWPSERSPP